MLLWAVCSTGLALPSLLNPLLVLLELIIWSSERWAWLLVKTISVPRWLNVWLKNMVNQVPPGEPQGFTFNFWRCGVFQKFFSDTRAFSLCLSSRVGTFHQLIAPGVGISQKSWKKSENPRGVLVYHIFESHIIGLSLQDGHMCCQLAGINLQCSVKSSLFSLQTNKWLYNLSFMVPPPPSPVVRPNSWLAYDLWGVVYLSSGWVLCVCLLPPL